MHLGLQDKVAIVGGASQGIGFAIARLLAAEGARVAMVARRRERLEQAVAQVGTQGGRACAIAADIRKADDCERIVAEAIAHYGRLDVLVNNDGAPPLGDLDAFDDAAWLRAIEQNPDDRWPTAAAFADGLGAGPSAGSQAKAARSGCLPLVLVVVAAAGAGLTRFLA